MPRARATSTSSPRPSTFHAITADAPGGITNVGVDLTAANAPIAFMTPVSVSGASTLNSGGGNITFEGTLAVANNLTLDTGNGTLAFDGPVGSTQTLTLNLGGGSVSGLGELQDTLTGLTVNAHLRHRAARLHHQRPAGLQHRDRHRHRKSRAASASPSTRR